MQAILMVDLKTGESVLCFEVYIGGIEKYKPVFSVLDSSSGRVLLLKYVMV